MSHDPQHADSPNPHAMPQQRAEPFEPRLDLLPRGRNDPDRHRVARDRIVLVVLALMAVAISFQLVPNLPGARAGNLAIPLPTDDPSSVLPTPTPTTPSPLATPIPTQGNAGVPAAPTSTVPAQPAFATSTPTATWTPPPPGSTPTWTPVLPQDQFIPNLPQQQAATIEALETAAFGQPVPQPPGAATPLPETGLVPPPPTPAVPTVPPAAPPPTATPILGIVVVPPPAQPAEPTEPVADRSLDLALFIDNLVIAFGYVWIACGLLLLPLAVIGGFLLARRPRPPYTPVQIPQQPRPPGPQAGAASPPPPPAPPPAARPAASGGSQRVAARHRSNGGNGGNNGERPPG